MIGKLLIGGHSFENPREPAQVSAASTTMP